MAKHVFKLPDVGEGVVEGEIVKWNVKPGDTVKEDEPLVELMTDKATVAIPSTVNGKVISKFIEKEFSYIRVFLKIFYKVIFALMLLLHIYSLL